MISSRKMEYYINNPFSLIIDLRTYNSYVKSHVKNAVNVPYNDMINVIGHIDTKKINYDRNNGYRRNIDYINNEESNSAENFEAKDDKLIRYLEYFNDKRKIYVFYCDRGALSLIICNRMSQAGYITKSVVGGFEQYIRVSGNTGKNIYWYNWPIDVKIIVIL